VKLMRKLLKKQGFAPEVLVTDKLRSYGAAKSEIGLTARNEQGLHKNNRATFNAILYPATRSAFSEARRCRIGMRRQWPEREPSPSDFRVGQSQVPVTVPARALAGRLTAKGGALMVRIDYLTLGPNTGATIHGGSSPDNIEGVATLNGAQWPVRATTSYMASPIDQTMIEQSNHDRVSQLAEALAFWIAQSLA
jgi:hypothetical protein